MRFFYCLFISIIIFSCAEKKNTANTSQLLNNNYILDNEWPRFGTDFKPGQPTGIGVNQQDHIFIFHRAGRLWTEPFPDSLISQNTVLELHAETGRIINSWGAHYFIMPHGLTVDKENNIWLTDVGLHQVFKFSAEGKLLMKLGMAGVPGNDSLHFNLPTDVAVADNGNFYVSDGYGNSRVVKFSPGGNYIKEWGSYGKLPGQFDIPHNITIGQDNTIYVADRQNNRVQSFDTSGNFLKEYKNDAKVEQLPSLAIDKANQLFAIDYDPTKKTDGTVNGSTIFKFDSSQNVKDRFGVTGSTQRTSCWLHDIAIDHKGNLYAGDIMGLKLLKFSPKKSL